jgi:hypothetical protein
VAPSLPLPAGLSFDAANWEQTRICRNFAFADLWGMFSPVIHGEQRGRTTMAVCFKGAHFPTEIILTCVRWSVAYPLSTRHIEELMQERGVSVDHSTAP